MAAQARAQFIDKKRKICSRAADRGALRPRRPERASDPIRWLRCAPNGSLCGSASAPATDKQFRRRPTYMARANDKSGVYICRAYETDCAAGVTRAPPAPYLYLRARLLSLRGGGGRLWPRRPEVHVHVRLTTRGAVMRLMTTITRFFQNVRPLCIVAPASRRVAPGDRTATLFGSRSGRWSGPAPRRERACRSGGHRSPSSLGAGR